MLRIALSDRLLALAARGLAALYALALIAWIRPIALDEFEFARATYWISQGLSPYRDFWEHHSPLQWHIFAWVPRMISVEGLRLHVALRLAQLPLWGAALVFLNGLAKRSGASSRSVALVTLLLLTAVGFVAPAVEFRVDTVSTLLIVAALALLARAGSGSALLAGVLVTLAVWANLRSVGVVAGGVAGLLIWAVRGRTPARWKQLGAAGLGAIAAGGGVLFYLAATDSLDTAVRMLVRENTVVDELLQGLSLAVPLRALVHAADLSGLVLLALGLAGTIIVMREAASESSSIRIVVAICWIAEALFLAVRGVVYPYHLQLLFALSVPLGARAVDAAEQRYESLSVRRILAGAVILALLFNFVSLLGTEVARTRFRVQKEMIGLASRRAGGGAVFDGTAWVVDAKPAYRFWFLPAAARLLTKAEGGLSLADFGERPRVVITDRRLTYWLADWPPVASWIARHYVPETRDVWVPGCSGRIATGSTLSCELQAGSWTLFASPVLSTHPWFDSPMSIPMAAGDQAAALHVEPGVLPPAAVLVDGVRIQSGGRLRTGSARSLTIENESALPLGVFVVPEGIESMFRPPEGGIFPEPAIFDLRGWR